MIPIYRAKKINSDEYVEGYYSSDDWTDCRDKKDMKPILKHSITDLERYQLRLDLYGDGKLHEDKSTRQVHEIDPTTIAIHFPSMIDSEGNKIFASLSEDGKGGDIVSGERYEDNYEYAKKNGKIEYFTEVVKFEIAETNISDICDTGAYSCSTNHTNLKIVGIQQ